MSSSTALGTQPEASPPRSAAKPAVAGAPLTLVVPVFHEQDNIARVLGAIDDKVRTIHETLVVYDKDDDPTVPVVRTLLSRHPSVRLLRNDLGKGVLKAITKGFAAAPDDGLVVVVMADLSDDLADVDRMYRLIVEEGYDLVCGSRYMRGGRQLGGPPLKSFLSRLAGATLHALAGLPTRDGTNAFRMYRASLLKALPIESRGGFELSLELTVKAHMAGYRITEVPTTWRDRTAGESRFQLMAWLPSYLRWYRLALGHAFLRTRRSRVHGR